MKNRFEVFLLSVLWKISVKYTIFKKKLKLIFLQAWADNHIYNNSEFYS